MLLPAPLLLNILVAHRLVPLRISGVQEMSNSHQRSHCSAEFSLNSDWKVLAGTGRGVMQSCSVAQSQFTVVGLSGTLSNCPCYYLFHCYGMWGAV